MTNLVDLVYSEAGLTFIVKLGRPCSASVSSRTWDKEEDVNTFSSHPPQSLYNQHIHSTIFQVLYSVIFYTCDLYTKKYS